MTQARVSITPADAWSDQRLTPLQCRLLGLIGSYLGKDHTAWPSQSTLARDLGVSRKAVNEGIKALVTYGYVQAQERFREDGGQTSSVYFVVMDPKDRDVVSGDTPCNPAVTPPSPARDTPCNPQEVTPPVTSKGYTKKDPLKDPREQDVLTLAFDTIWKAWSPVGRKRSKSQSLCKQALKRCAADHDLRDLTRAALRYAKATNPEFHKGLHTWLAGGFYENFLPSKAPVPTLVPQADLTDLERAFDQFAKTGEWTGDRYGHPLPPIHPSASYAAELYARFGVAQPAERSAA
jgi:hypothetical protein